MNVGPSQAWGQTLALIRESILKQQYGTWFQLITYEPFSGATYTLLMQVPSLFMYEYLEGNYIDLLSKVLKRSFRNNIRSKYRTVTDQEHHLT